MHYSFRTLNVGVLFHPLRQYFSNSTCSVPFHFNVLRSFPLPRAPYFSTRLVLRSFPLPRTPYFSTSTCSALFHFHALRTCGMLQSMQMCQRQHCVFPHVFKAKEGCRHVGVEFVYPCEHFQGNPCAVRYQTYQPCR